MAENHVAATVHFVRGEACGASYLLNDQVSSNDTARLFDGVQEELTKVFPESERNSLIS
ncbi:hypothetical protein [Metallosphaera hakonensis]|uniref:hypothetical protein n=1 Tax=Metallosphaera hakonensis TaxID=79601 RepID=UPI000A5F0EB9|nr:hypothetical protein [Metallosphaera hakonensis]